VLWYKAWLETRARFLTCFATVVIFCTVFVDHALHVVCAESLSCSAGLWDPARQAEVYRLLFINQQFLVFMWILSVVLLGMGGIVREGAIGTAAPTLALPVSRARLQGVRVGMGVLQAIALAVFALAFSRFCLDPRGPANIDETGRLLHPAVSGRWNGLFRDVDPDFIVDSR